MEVRLATKQDIDAVCHIYEAAKQFMATHGNPDQWPGEYPGLREAKGDVRRGTLMVAVNDSGEVVGCFDFEGGDIVDYLRIDGAWLNKFPYYSIHRMAVLRQGEGIGGAMLDWICKAANNVRVDTHEDNKPMQALLESRGFVRCGTVHLRHVGDRIAYHFARPDDRLEVKKNPYWFWKR